MAGGVSTAALRVHIDELSEVADPSCSGRHLEAVVALIWPYSSNTGRLSLLLVEDDVSIYKQVGQVKATFYGAVAQELAKSRVGIGDKVRLSLEDARATYNDNDNVVSTPGKKTHWEFHFRRSIHIELLSSTLSPRSITFSAPSLSPRSSLNGTHINEYTVPPSASSVPTSTSLKTPLRVTSNTYHTPYDNEFELDDGTVPGRGRKRTKFARHSGAWRLIDRPEDEVEVNDRSDTNNRMSAAVTNGLILDVQASTPVAPPSLSPVKVLETLVSIHDSSRAAVVLSGHDAGDEAMSPPALSSSQLEQVADQPHHGTETCLEHESSHQAHELNEVAEREPLVSPDSRGQSLWEGLPMASSVTHTEQVVIHDPDAASPSQPLLTDGVHPNLSPSGAEQPPATRNRTVSPGSDAVGADIVVEEATEYTTLIPSSLDALDDSRNIITQTQTSRISGDAEQAVLVPFQQAASPEQSQLPGVEHMSEDSYVDFDRLQQEIDAQRETSHPPPREFIEDEDMYGSSVILGEAEALTHLSYEAEPGTTDEHDLEHESVSGTYSESVIGMLSETDGSRSQSVEEETSPTKEDHITQNERDNISPSDIPGGYIYDTSKPEEHAIMNDQPTCPEDPEAEHPHTTQVVSDSNQGARTSYVDNMDYDHGVLSSLDTQEHLQASAIHAWQDGPYSLVPAKLDTLLYTPNPTQEQQEDSESGAPIQGTHMFDLPMTPVATQQNQYQYDGVSAEATTVLVRSDQVYDSTDVTVPKPRESDNLFADYFTPRELFDPNDTSDLADLLDIPTIEESEDILKTVPIDQDEGEKVLRRQDSVQAAFDAFAHGNITDVSYYAPLSSLAEHFSQNVDVLAVLTSDTAAPERAQSGARDFHTTLQLTDLSLGTYDDTTVTAQIFRPHRSALPLAKRGEVILLRNMLVETRKHKPLLSSTDSSAWAVFNSTGSQNDGSLDRANVTVSGPPVEYGDLERERVQYLHQWWLRRGHGEISDDSSSHRGQMLRATELGIRVMKDERDARTTGASEEESRPFEDVARKLPNRDEVQVSPNEISDESLTMDQTIDPTLESYDQTLWSHERKSSSHESDPGVSDRDITAPAQSGLRMATQHKYQEETRTDTTMIDENVERVADEESDMVPHTRSDSATSDAEDVMDITSDSENVQLERAASAYAHPENASVNANPVSSTEDERMSDHDAMVVECPREPTITSADGDARTSESKTSGTKSDKPVEVSSADPAKQPAFDASSDVTPSGPHVDGQLSPRREYSADILDSPAGIKDRQDSDTEPASIVASPVVAFEHNSSFQETQSLASYDTRQSKRYRRRDTSNVHELRDGTTYIDYEDHEIVSVTSDEDIQEDEEVVQVGDDVEFDELEAMFDHRKEVVSTLQAETTLHELEEAILSEGIEPPSIEEHAATERNDTQGEVKHSVDDDFISVRSALGPFVRDQSYDHSTQESNLLPRENAGSHSLSTDPISDQDNRSTSNSQSDIDSDDSAAAQLRLEASQSFSVGATASGHSELDPISSRRSRGRGRPPTKKRPAQAQAQTNKRMATTDQDEELRQDEVPQPLSSPSKKNTKRSAKARDVDTDRVTRSKAGK